VVVRRGIGIAALVAATTTVLCGCSETMSLTRLPDLSKVPEKVLTKDEQKGRVDEMISRGQDHRKEAVKEIENGK
jgi:hypothetical protein